MEKDIISNLSDLKSNEKYQCPKGMYDNNAAFGFRGCIPCFHERHNLEHQS
jgi:hypothetical protein